MNEHSTLKSQDAPVRCVITEGIMRLTLDKPEKRNTLSENTLDALDNYLTEAKETQEIRLVIINAVGPVFCAGHDLKELTAGRNNPDKGEAYFTEILHKCSTVMQKIVRLPKPVVADVRAVATAAGCQLVASCDLALASTEAKFATPGVNIGLFCSTPMVALSRNVSNKHAMEMLLTGDFVNAERAAEIGLINRAIPEAEMDDAINELANKITSKSAMTLKIGKEAFYKQAELPLSEAYDYASKVMVKNMMKHDAKEGINAFIEKRQANWQDE